MALVSNLRWRMHHPISQSDAYCTGLHLNVPNGARKKSGSRMHLSSSFVDAKSSSQRLRASSILMMTWQAGRQGEMGTQCRKGKRR